MASKRRITSEETSIPSADASHQSASMELHQGGFHIGRHILPAIEAPFLAVNNRHCC